MSVRASDLLGLPVVADDRVPEDLVLLVPSGARPETLHAKVEDPELLDVALAILRDRGIPVSRGAVLVRDVDRFKEQLAAYAADRKEGRIQ